VNWYGRSMPRRRARLAKLGMTEPEIDAWLALADAGTKFAALPQLHPMAEHEAAHALHRVEDLLLARPGMRAQGWGLPPDAMPDADERRARLARFGMTDEELELWYATAELAGRMLELPEPGAATDERHEIVHALHRIQDELLARPGRRALSG
jgi:hypothetical protein